jgi:hypothetical protein
MVGKKGRHTHQSSMALGERGEVDTVVAASRQQA